jgi:hypothetical protein
MTSNRYVIRNCPCIKHYDEIELDNRCMSTQDDKLFFCENNTDCLIKQIYEMCKSQKKSSCIFAVAFLADRILQLFDIEEINK